MDRALLARVEKQAWFHRFPRGLPIAMFLVALVATLMCVLVIERADREARQVELERNAAEVANALQRRAAESIAFLSAGSSLFSTQSDVDANRFREFTALVNHDYQQRGIMGIGWAARVEAKDGELFEAVQQSLGVPDYAIRPAATSPAQMQFPVTYLEPQTPENRAALGFDMYSERSRRAAMDAAARTGKPVMTPRVQLIQDAGEAPVAGFLIYVPAYGPGVEGRQLRGFVYSPFRANEFLDSATDLVRSRPIDIRLYDEFKADANLLAKRELRGQNGVSMDVPMTIGGHRWLLNVTDKRPAGLTILSLLTLLFGVSLGLMLAAITRIVTRRAVEDRKVLEWLTRQSAIRTSLTRELNHRVKNTLANVLSIVSLTRRRSSSIDEFAESLTGRVRALSATHDLLSQRDWSNAPLQDVVRSELAPYLDHDDSHVELSGPDVDLAPNDALSLGLAIHELATNAAKYGALSTTQGRVAVKWQQPRPDLVEVHWSERNGPPVTEPERRGFGLDLIQKIVAHELHNAVDMTFAPEGVECTLRVPVRDRTEFEIRGGRKPD